MSQEVKVVGMAWYKPEDYDEIRRLSADGESMAPTYQDWLDSAQELFDRVKSKGHTVEKVYIDPDTFPKCRLPSTRTFCGRVRCRKIFWNKRQVQRRKRIVTSYSQNINPSHTRPQILRHEVFGPTGR